MQNISNLDYIFSVKGLLIPKMSERALVFAAFEEYINSIPELSGKLVEHLFAGEITEFSAIMRQVISLLRRIGARWLESDADLILKAAVTNNLQVCRDKLTPFVTELYSLSIEMQMAQSKVANSVKTVPSDIEVFSGIYNNLEAATRLIDEGECEKAFSMLSAVLDVGGDPLAAELVNAVLRSETQIASGLVRALKAKYSQLMSSIIDTRSEITQKILAVDDRPEILMSVSQTLRNNYKVLGAPGGKIALKILNKEQIDLFILDIDMPEMNGYELADSIRNIERYAYTPIIFLTSNANREYVIKALQCGGNDFIVKPANHSTLLSKVAKFLR